MLQFANFITARIIACKRGNGGILEEHSLERIPPLYLKIEKCGIQMGRKMSEMLYLTILKNLKMIPE